ncbi:hypothetical protein LCGC14_0955620 [marine sediment metagenome]|uniref:Uncharacterized protein n=1 Tax=marine sediment metagenome TaxID=412755 RepID=A0A0F9RME7_9ZZZZ
MQEELNKKLAKWRGLKDFHIYADDTGNYHKIQFIDPEHRLIKETSEDFLRIFIKEALIKIKETNPNMSLEYHYYKNSDLIDRINITKLSSIIEFDLITAKIRELLAEEISSDN